MKRHNLKNSNSEKTEEDGFDTMHAFCRLPIRGFKGFNFLKGPYAPRKKQAEVKKRIVRSIAIASLVAVIALTSLFAKINILEDRKAILEDRIVETFRQTFPEVRKVREPVHQMKEKINAYYLDES